jgi:hypothetical protein
MRKMLVPKLTAAQLKLNLEIRGDHEGLSIARNKVRSCTARGGPQMLAILTLMGAAPAGGHGRRVFSSPAVRGDQFSARGACYGEKAR